MIMVIHSNSSTLNSISILEFTESDILAVISSLKNNSAGYDDISSSLIKKIRDEVAKPSTILINSIRPGIIPSELKLLKLSLCLKVSQPWM